MIRACGGSSVRRLVEAVIVRPQKFVKAVFCAPFIDDDIFADLVKLASPGSRRTCDLVIITSRSIAANFRSRHASTLRCSVVPVDHLHAKIYLAVATESCFTEAIITSANLTTAGMLRNIEFGVHVRPTTAHGREAIGAVASFLGRLVESQRLYSSIRTL
jgi:hypothetical protein